MDERPIYRQGDVLLNMVARLPAAAAATSVAPSDGRLLLALGEVTGHAHAVDAADAELLDVRSAEGIDCRAPSPAECATRRRPWMRSSSAPATSGWSAA